MNTHVDKTQGNKSQAVSAADSQMQSGGESAFQFVDNRPEAVAQRKLQEMANNSPQVSQLRAFQEMANNSPQAKQAAQIQTMADNHSAKQQPIQKNENNTGLPNNLKTGMENLSGYSMDDVKVHRNSDKPAQLNAHAYAQGTDIHLGPGQEQHLPHEAWHVVQQKQGRVKPTTQLKGKVNINDDAGLEKEADVMGARAIQAKFNVDTQHATVYDRTVSNTIQRQVDQDNFPDFVDAQFGLQERFLAEGKGVGDKDNYTTVGYEHEFAQLDGQTGLSGYTHQEVAKTGRKWPIKNQPFLLETDAANALELVSPPFLIETREDRPVPLAEDVKRVDDFTSDFLAGMENMTIENMLDIFRDIGLDFKLDPIVLDVLSWTPGAQGVPGSELSAEEINSYKIKESKKGGAGISSQWNMAMDAESIEGMQQGKPRVKNQDELAAHKALEGNLRALAQRVLVSAAQDSKLGLFHHQFARSLAGIAYVPYIKEQKKRKEAANAVPVAAAGLPAQAGVPAQVVAQQPMPGSMATVSDGNVRSKSSRLKDMNNVWLKEDLVTYAMKVLTPQDWAAIAGDRLTEIHDAINVAIIPDTMGLPVDKFGEVVDLLKRSVITLNAKAQAIVGGAAGAGDFPASRAGFLGHNDDVAGARQDTFIAGGDAKLPGRWKDVPLHVVEVREIDQDNFRLLDAVSKGRDAVIILLEEWVPARRQADLVRALWADIKQSFEDIKQINPRDARNKVGDLARVELLGKDNPQRLKALLDDLHAALDHARAVRDRQEAERDRRAAEADERQRLIDEQEATGCLDQLVACFAAIASCCGKR
jgi:hypothetical protein